MSATASAPAAPSPVDDFLRQLCAFERAFGRLGADLRTRLEREFPVLELAGAAASAAATELRTRAMAGPEAPPDRTVDGIIRTVTRSTVVHGDDGTFFADVMTLQVKLRTFPGSSIRIRSMDDGSARLVIRKWACQGGIAECTTLARLAQGMARRLSDAGIAQF